MTRVALPSGFGEVRQERQTWWVREEWAAILPQQFASWGSPQPHLTPASTQGGRSDLLSLPLPEGGQALVRQYRRGGFVRHFVRDLYWERPFRPFAELCCTEEARRRGVPTIEALAAGVLPTGWGFYRGVFVSRKAEGFVNLWQWLRQHPRQSERHAVLAAVAQAIVRMHDAGIFHADLNLTNILVRPETSPPEARLIDFDRGQVQDTSLARDRREHNLQRLQRSWRKLDRAGQFSSPADLDTLLRTYALHS